MSRARRLNTSRCSYIIRTGFPCPPRAKITCLLQGTLNYFENLKFSGVSPNLFLKSLEKELLFSRPTAIIMLETFKPVERSNVLANPSLFEITYCAGVVPTRMRQAWVSAKAYAQGQGLLVDSHRPRKAEAAELRVATRTVRLEAKKRRARKRI